MTFHRMLLLCTAFAALTGMAPVSAQTVLKLGWTTTDAPDDPYAVGARAFKDEVEKRLPGTVTVQLYPNRQLGDEKQLVEGLRFGTVDAAIVTNAVVAQLEPALQLNDLPFLFTSAEHARRVLDGTVGEELAKKLDAKGLVVLGYMEGGFRHMLNNKQPVREPKDVQSVKYRVMQNPVYIDMFNALGGAAVPMAWSETYTAVQQGTIDGLEMPLPIAVSSKYSEVTKYLSLTSHTYSANELMISKRVLNKLTSEQRVAVLAAGKAATATQRQHSTQSVEKLLATIRSEGMQVNQPEDFTPFQLAVRPIHDKYSQRFGAALIDAVRNATN